MNEHDARALSRSDELVPCIVRLCKDDGGAFDLDRAGKKDSKWIKS